MTQTQTLPSLPPRSNNPFRSWEPSQKSHNHPNQTAYTPAALYNKFQAPSIDHIHDFRQCYAFAINTLKLMNDDNSNNEIRNDLTTIDTNNDEHNEVDVSTAAAITSSTTTSSNTDNTSHSPFSTNTSQWSSKFLCHICHSWLCVTSSAFRHTCPNDDYATHHYHATDTPPSTTMTTREVYTCCGCQDTVELSYHDAIVPATLLLDLSSTRALTRTYLDTTQQTALKPTLTSTLSTCQKYISDLLENTRRNINTQNPHFLERIGLDETTTRLLNIIGFNYQNGFFLAPTGDVDNDQLYMIREELNASLLEIAQTTKQTVGVTEADCPLADLVVLNDLLGCQDTVEHDIHSGGKTGLDIPCGVLGITSSASDDLIVWAYRQMTQEQPELLYDLLDALNDITSIKGGETLQTEVTIERSKGFISRKDVDLAYQYFGAQKDIEDETLIAAHQYKVQDYPIERTVHDDRLRTIGESRKSGSILRYLEGGSMNAQGMMDQGMFDYSQIGLPSNSPVGLTNIGNTCYLNSLLQYYYTLVPFRNTILNMDEFVENEDKIDWQSKKIGGIQVDFKEVKRAKKFVGLLQNLFIQLGQTDANEIAPELELAKMALFNEKDDTTERGGLGGSTDAKDGGSSMEESVSTLVESKKGSDDESNINDNNTVFTQQSTQESDLNTLRAADCEKTTTTTTANKDHSPSPPILPKRSTTDMNTMMLGKQQDVTECMDNVMYLVEAALKPQQTDNMEQVRDMVRDLFYGKARQILSYKDTETTKEIQKVMEEDFSHVIVDAADGKNLYDGLDEYFFADKVENYQGGQEATREVTVQTFPPVLQIQVQRVQFDRATSQVYKSNAFVQFDKTIYLDRYLDSNFESLAPRREKVASWAKQLEQYRDNIKKLSVKVDSVSSGQQLDLSVPWMFEKTASILEGYEPSQSILNPIDLSEAVRLLKEEASSTNDSLKANIAQVNEYETKIRHEYDDLTECAYLLHAVFMHKGEANYGHYWLYILDHETDCWWKFNDSYVTKVEESEILKDTTGTKSNPYFLVYISKDAIDTLAAFTRTGA
ncbi:hypothetical protein BCR42DRAFT_489060 [Absidia repens]|uniref:ubiquitinyl hydrolase 1 n=1 Tax=Absidia repens TaxID=90262 RepID=A0A1X2IQL4_9FUNG|nr:hypothetical protein BCR42DRAFT_489060 [Absidia repens]